MRQGMTSMPVPKKNRSVENTVTSVYVCPKTKQPLFEEEDGLTTHDGIRYEFVRGWNNTAIPDFLHASELGDAGKKSQTMYDKSASVELYRNFLNWLFQTFNEDPSAFRKSLIQRLNLKKGDKALVTGCGTGDDIPAIIEVVGNDGEVYAQDLSSEMTIAASEFVISTHPSAKICFSISNANLLPFADDFFDGAFHFGGINLFDDMRSAISEMERVVKPGGRVVFGDEGVAPWLKDTEYGRMAITNNSLWNANAPIDLLPRNVVDVNLSWILGNCFYTISFGVSEKGPFMNIDVPHKGRRGGSMRTRYFGLLEGVTEESKRFVLEDSERMGISVSDWLEQTIKSKQQP
jgi:SAM-dependent methyltransferase